MVWFKDWFSTPYYHLLYGERDEKEASDFIKALLQFLKPKEASIFLDLACGKGRHASDIAEYNYLVYGVDLSYESIETAKLLSNSNLHFDVHDMRLIYKSSYFDYILNLFTSFGYFEDVSDNTKTLSAVVNDLKVEGFFVQDYFNSEKVEKLFVPFEKKKVNGIQFEIAKKVQENRIIKNISFQDQGCDYEFSEQVSLFNLKDFETMYEDAGLEIINVFGDYNLNPFNANHSDRLILISKKII